MLTVAGQRGIVVGGGVRTSENTESGSRPDSLAAIFTPALWREGDGYNTRKGKKSARLLTFGRFSGS